MRGKAFIFYQSEIQELLAENGINTQDMDKFLEAFDNPAEWIHLFVEWLKDQESEKKLG